MITIAAIAMLSSLLPGTGASAATADTTRPTTPLWGYSEGFSCLKVILGTTRSTDNVTPQSVLRYAAFADGEFIGTLIDDGLNGGPWGLLHLKKTGTSWVTVQAVDAAGNRSAPSRANPVTGYWGSRCAPLI